MSALDRAFIRAYGNDVPASAEKKARTAPAKSPAAPVSAAARAKVAVSAPASAPTADEQNDVPTILPLSAFATQQPAEAPFRPAFEVDRFVWSTRCEEILAAAGDGFDVLAKQLLAEGIREKVVALTGCRRGEGRTTLLLALARRLAAAGSRIALVDADFTSGQLGRQLGLSVRVGLEDVLGGDLSVEEVLVESLEDRISLLPIRQTVTSRGTQDKLRLAVTLGILRDKYDAVLVDAGPLDTQTAAGDTCLEEGSGVTATLVVSNPRYTTDQHLARVRQQLRAAGIDCWGIVENFVEQQRNLAAA